MSQVVQATCPKCKKTLNIPSDWKGATFRCQGCGQVLKTAAPAPARAGVPVGQPVSKNGTAPRTRPAAPPREVEEDDGGSLVAKLRQRRRRRFYLKLVIFLFLLMNAGLAALIWREDLSNAIQQGIAAIKKEDRPAVASASKPDTKPQTKPEEKPPRNLVKVDKPPEGDPPMKPPVEKPPNEVKSPTKLDGEPMKPTPMVPATTTVSKTHPGRALLVGIRNYLYANPLNPGYRPDQSLTRDPLGLHSLKKVLTDGLKFDKDQVVELSDVASENPRSPLKATVQATIRLFLESGRPQDRIVVVFAGHAIEIEDQGYLVPLEGEFTKKEDLIPVTWLYDQLDKCKAHRKLLILDVCHLDPEQGLARSGGEKMGDKLEGQLRKVPDGVQVWMSCSGKENSYEFASSGFIGSVFMHYLQDFSKDLADPKKRREIEKEPGFNDESLPLLHFAPKVNKEVTEYVKNRWNAVQTPKVLGVSAKAPDVAANAAPPPEFKVVEPLGAEKLADAKVIDEIVQDIGLSDIGAQSLPPFLAKHLEPYQTDADKDPAPEKHSLRQITLDTVKKIEMIDKRFNAEKSIRSEANDAQFKKTIEKKQQEPAKLDQELQDVMTTVEKAEKERDKETKRWQAHFDYVFTQLLARRIAIMEYNFVLGNKLRKDSPVVKNAQNNGWLIVPYEKLQQKDTRDWEKKRQEILERLIKEHPDTPWAIISRRDKNTFLGLTIQEAKVD